MNLFYKRAILFILILISGEKLLAQSADSTIADENYVQPFSKGSAYRTWSIGINAGAMSTSNILTSNARLGFTVPSYEYGYAGYIKKQILPSFGIQADFMMGKLNGDDAQLNSAGVSPFKSFTTKVNYASSLSGNITLANINWRFIKSTILPYVTAGSGLMNYTPVTTSSTGVVANFNKTGNGAINEFFVPVGAGLKFNVARGINLDLGYQVNFVYSNNLDGYHYGYSNEKFSYAHIGLEFAFGSHSKPQLSVHNPVASMRQEYLSGIQNAKLGMQAKIDSEKVKNQALEQRVALSDALIAKLTVDSDGDGVSDYFDKCPNTPKGTPVDGSGCPLPVPVVKPEEKIYITEEDRGIVNEAVQNLQFNTGSAVISDQSFPSLARLAKLLADKKFNLKLAGYTDATGSAALNLRLSKARAEAVKTFLASHGANASLIQADGYGKARPIASNRTKAGRKLNRRVEFSLYQ